MSHYIILGVPVESPRPLSTDEYFCAVLAIDRCYREYGARPICVSVDDAGVSATMPGEINLCSVTVTV